MSLEELLKEPGDLSLWKGQRDKLIRIGTGILVIGVSLIAGIMIILSFRGQNALSKQSPPVADQEGQARSLARLMAVKEQTDELRGDLNQIRRDANPPTGHGARSGDGSDTRVINYDPGEGFVSLAVTRNEVYIPTGAVFQARLLTPIKTSIERTFVMAETTSEFRMDMKRRIQIGSRLIGRSRLNPVLKGVIVEFDTLVSPTGIESRLSGLALSKNALPEIEGMYFSDRMTNYGTALAFGFLSGFADAARTRDITLLGPTPRVNTSNQVLAGLSTASFQVADEILRDIRSSAIEYVVVPAGEQVFVVLTQRYDVAQGGAK